MNTKISILAIAALLILALLIATPAVSVALVALSTGTIGCALAALHLSVAQVTDGLVWGR